MSLTQSPVGPQRLDRQDCAPTSGAAAAPASSQADEAQADKTPDDELDTACAQIAVRLSRRGRAPAVARVCIWGVACFLAVIALAGAALIVRLGHGPMKIDALGPSVAQALDERFGHGYAFAIGQMAMLKRGYSPTLSADGLSVRDAAGRTILSAPRAEVSVDLLSLAAGRVVPKRLEVFDVELRLALLPDGSIAQLAASGSGEPVALTPPLAQSLEKEGAPQPAQGAEDAAAQPKPRALLVKQMAAAVRLIIDALTSPQSQIAAVDRVAIMGGRVMVEDRTTSQTMVFGGVNLAFDKAEGGTTFALSADGPNGRWSASGEASGAPGAQRRLTFSLQDLSADELLIATGVRSLGADFDMPLSATVAIGLRPDGVLSEAAASFSFGSGYFRFDDPADEPLMVDHLAGGAHWDGAQRRIVIDPIRLVAGETHGAVGGTVAPPEREGDPWTVELGAAEPIVAAPERPGQKPVTVDSLALIGRLYLAQKKFTIERLHLGGPQAGFAMAGDVEWSEGPRLRLGAVIEPTPIATVTRLWPSFMAAPVRNYLIDHVTQGVVKSGTMRLDFNAADLDAMRNEHAPPDDSLLIEFTVAGGGVAFLDGVPPLTGLDGVGRITGRSSSFVTTSAGLIDVGAGRTLTTAPGGAFHIADSELRPTPASIVANVSGGVEAVGDLLAFDSLKAYASLPLDRSTLRGEVSGRIEVGLRLGPNMGPKDTILKINAQATNLTADNLLGKEPLEAATLAIAVDETGLKASGQGRMFGAPATLDLAQPAGKPASANLRVIVDDAARARQGLDGLPGVSGPITALIAAPLGGPTVRADVELDLSRATIDWPGVAKPAGRPGKARFVVNVADGASLIDQLSIDLGAMQAKGQVQLGADQGVQWAKFPQIKFSPGDDARLEALRAGDSLKVMVRAQTLDARPFLKSVLASEGPSSSAGAGSGAGAGAAGRGQEIDIDVRSALLTGHNKQMLTGLELRMLKRGEQVRQLSFAGRFGRDTVSGNMSGGGRLTVLSDDAGSLLLFTDLYRHMEGGRMRAELDLGGPSSSSLVIDSFVLRDEPALRRLVAESSASPEASGKLRNIDAGAMAFNRLQVAFDRSGTRLVLRDGVLNGEAIGLTVEGWLDFPRDGVDIKGTFVPAYAVNNLFSKIPVVGVILGGGANEGLIGVNYRVEGKISAPTLSINPLSAIAPGIFRQIFGVGQNVPASQ